MSSPSVVGGLEEAPEGLGFIKKGQALGFKVVKKKKKKAAKPTESSEICYVALD